MNTLPRAEPASSPSSPRPRLVVAIVVLVAALSPRPVRSQIRLVPGPQSEVSASPTYITKGDFYGHNDGIDDVAVTNGKSQITTLKAQAGSTAFGTTRPFTVGSVLQGLAAGNFNGNECVGGSNPQVDCNSDPNICNGGTCEPVTDVAVADKRRARVFWPFGNNDGNFRSPGNVSTVLRSAIDVAVGNFDSPDPQKKDDLAVLNSGLAKVSVLLNQGAGFPPQSTTDYPVGDNPKRIITAQLDDDVYDDIVTVDTGTAGADSVSVLLSTQSYNKGGYTVGAQAVDVVAGNFSNHPDNAPADLVALNRGSQSTVFSLSILINDGTGQFDAKPGVVVNCPPTIGGIPIYCQPNFIAAGDLDGDGFADLAITVRTQAQSTNAAVSTGLLMAFKGDGKGGFTLGDQITVGLNPQGIVAGNFTGRSDGIKDLAIVEQGTNTVRIIKPLAPPKLGAGVTCNKSEQCVTGLFCVNGTCCDTGIENASCPDDLRCDIPGKAGTCQAPGVPGDRCTDDPEQCAPPNCVDGFCCETDCAAPLVCNTGTCDSPSDVPGTPCNSTNEFGGNNQCAEPLHCADGVCCQVGSGERCPFGQACNIQGSEGTCASMLPTPTRTQTPTSTPVGTDCCQCAQSCSAPVNGSCSDCTLVVDASCEGGLLCVTNTPTPTASTTLTPTPTPSTTFTPTPSVTAPPTSTSTPTPTGTSTQTATHTPTNTPPNTPTDTPRPTATPLATSTPTNPFPTPTPPSSLTPTPSASCTGDCDSSGDVTVNELIILVNIALGNAQPSACLNGIPVGAEVDITLIIQAVNSALTGCGG
jgi:hypothetical protein